jgi:pyruvate kinase
MTSTRYIPNTDKALLCTLGPASLNEPTIKRLADLGATLFRLNLSHTNLEQLTPAIDIIQKSADVPVCIDTEGAQVRTGRMADKVELRYGNKSMIVRDSIIGNAERFNLYPSDIADYLKAGDIISIDFNAALVQILAISEPGLELRILSGGRVGSNKAVTVQRELTLPALTAKDRAAVEIAKGMGVQNYALSFANSARDVKELRDMVGDEARIISKIECRQGLRNLDEIGRASNALLIDRGDLSREILIEQIPRIQKTLIRRAKKLERPIYVATNLLESMVDQPTPTRAEVNDIYNTLSDGADGLVLAAETAIGAFPVRCAEMVVRMVREYQEFRTNDQLSTDDRFSLLPPPHGGKLIEQTTPPQIDLTKLPKLRVAMTDLMDCELLANGTYSPLGGFMTRRELDSVLSSNCLPDGTIWTMPILLQVSNDKDIGPGSMIALTSADDRIHALLEVSEKYSLDKGRIATAWFGSDSPAHPGVARFYAAGDTALAGRVILVEPLPSRYKAYEFSPHRTRFVFAHNGWSRVVGFHTRNVCHRAHEFLQLEALRRVNGDGIYVSPVVGPKKPNDFLTGPILDSYRVLLDNADYPKEKYLLGGFPTYSRYAGPREAVFTALCRKNMGCSHFIVGRDHTGVGNYYAVDANQRIFDELGDIGISPVFFDTIGFDPRTGSYAPSLNDNHAMNISGTQFREALLAGNRVPSWFVRDEIQDMLLGELAAGRAIFQS